MTVGERISAQRKKKKMTPEEICAKLDIEAALYSSWERGDVEPDTEHLLSLARILGTSANYLLYGSDGFDVQSIFPKDATPAQTPISDWRFLCGALLMFAGGAGVLLFIMRNSVAASSLAGFFELGGAPLIALIAVFGIGLLVCVGVCISRGVKRRRHRRSVNRR